MSLEHELLTQRFRRTRQLGLGLILLYRVQGGFKLRWPLVAECHLEVRRFSWRNLALFLLVNVFIVLPAVIVYLGFCASLAVHHFSDGLSGLLKRIEDTDREAALRFLATFYRAHLNLRQGFVGAFRHFHPVPSTGILCPCSTA